MTKHPSHPRPCSPEVASLPRSGKGCVDGRAADVWSLAITMFTVVMAALPWNSASPADPFFGEYLMRRRYGELGAVFGHDMSAKRLFTTEFCILFDRCVLYYDRLASRNRPCSFLGISCACIVLA